MVVPPTSVCFRPEDAPQARRVAAEVLFVAENDDMGRTARLLATKKGNTEIVELLATKTQKPMDPRIEHQIYLKERAILDLREQGNYKEAIQLAIQAREFIESEVGRNNLEFRMILECLVELYEKIDQKQEAVELRRQIRTLDDGHRGLLGGVIWRG